MSIGERIRQIRKKNGMDQKTLAAILQKSQSNISEMEKKSINITIEDIRTICRTFKISADWLIMGKETESIDISHCNETEREIIINIVRAAEERERKTIKIGNL